MSSQALHEMFLAEDIPQPAFQRHFYFGSRQISVYDGRGLDLLRLNLTSLTDKIARTPLMNSRKKFFPNPAKTREDQRQATPDTQLAIDFQSALDLRPLPMVCLVNLICEGRTAANSNLDTEIRA